MFVRESAVVVAATTPRNSYRADGLTGNKFPSHVEIRKLHPDHQRVAASHRFKSNESHDRSGSRMLGRYINFYITNNSSSLNSYIVAGVLVGSVVFLVLGCALWQYCKQRFQQNRSTRNDDNNNYNNNTRGGRGSVRLRHGSPGDEELGYVCPSLHDGGDDDDDDDVSERSRLAAAGATYILSPFVSSSDNCHPEGDDDKHDQQCLHYEYEEHDVAITTVTDVDNVTTDVDSVTTTSVANDDLTADSSSNHSSNTLQYDDNYHTYILTPTDDCTDPELSALAENTDDMNDYLADLVLTFTPAGQLEEEEEQRHRLIDSDVDTDRCDDSPQSDESFTVLQDMKAMPEFSPYHLTWSTPHQLLERRKDLHLPPTTKKTKPEGATLSLPPSAPRAPLSHHGSEKAPLGTSKEQALSSTATRGDHAAGPTVECQELIDVHDGQQETLSSSYVQQIRGKITDSIGSIGSLLTNRRRSSEVDPKKPSHLNTPRLPIARALKLFHTPVAVTRKSSGVDMTQTASNSAQIERVRECGQVSLQNTLDADVDKCISSQQPEGRSDAHGAPHQPTSHFPSEETIRDQETKTSPVPVCKETGTVPTNNRPQKVPERLPTRRGLDNVFLTPTTSRPSSVHGVSSTTQQTALGPRLASGANSAGKLTNRVPMSAEALVIRKSKTLATLSSSAHASLRGLAARCSLGGAASMTGSSLSKFESLSDSLHWDSFPFRGESESMLWDDELDHFAEEDEQVFSGEVTENETTTAPV